MLRVANALVRTGMLVGSALLAGCTALPPQGRTPYQPDDAMQTVLNEWQAMRARPVAGLLVSEARSMPTLQDAARAIRNIHGLPAPATPASVETLSAAGPAGPLEARLYRPMAPAAKPQAVILYFAGGTWVTGTLDGYDESARQLSARSGLPVVAIRTRLAPEAKFPEVHDDAIAAYEWALRSVRSWGGDPARVVLAGEGAGANLAMATALSARQHGLRMPKHVLLITPLVSTSLGGVSMDENGKSRPLTRATVDWAQDFYTVHGRDLDDARLNLASRTDLAPFPPTTLVLAEIDPLRTEGEEIAAALTAARVSVQSRVFRGVTHDFFGLGLVVPAAAAAEQYAADQVRASVAPAPARPPARRAVRRPAHRRHRR